MRAFAVAYCNAATQREHLYAALLQGLVNNLKETAMANVILITDDATPCGVGGVHCLRVPRTQPLMVWRLKAHQYAHNLADEILFVEPDVRLNENILPIFDEDAEFDVCVTPREIDVKWKGENLGELAPYTLGTTFSRSSEFWREAKMHCQTLPADDQKWTGDMISVAHIVDSGRYKVRMLDGKVYNHVPNDPADVKIAKAIHYKGKRKAWLFPQVEEAAA